jgi:hypothetical protein
VPRWDITFDIKMRTSTRLPEDETAAAWVSPRLWIIEEVAAKFYEKHREGIEDQMKIIEALRQRCTTPYGSL